MGHLAVGIYIESFVQTCLKNKHPLNLCLYIFLNEKTIGRHACQKKMVIFYNIDMICEKYFY